MACACCQLCRGICIEQSVILRWATLSWPIDLPSANAIDLQINPPDTRNSDNTPEVCFTKQSSRSRPLDQGEPGETKEDQKRYPQEEEELKVKSALVLVIRLRSEDFMNIPLATGRAMEYCLQHSRQGRKAQCQSLRWEY